MEGESREFLRDKAATLFFDLRAEKQRWNDEKLCFFSPASRVFSALSCAMRHAPRSARSKCARGGPREWRREAHRAQKRRSFFFLLPLSLSSASAADVCLARTLFFFSRGHFAIALHLRTLAARSFSSMYAVTLAILRGWCWRREGEESGADGGRRKGDVQEGGGGRRAREAKFIQVVRSRRKRERERERERESGERRENNEHPQQNNLSFVLSLRSCFSRARALCVCRHDDVDAPAPARSRYASHFHRSRVLTFNDKESGTKRKGEKKSHLFFLQPHRRFRPRRSRCSNFPLFKHIPPKKQRPMTPSIRQRYTRSSEPAAPKGSGQETLKK